MKKKRFKYEAMSAAYDKAKEQLTILRNAIENKINKDKKKP